MSSNRVVREWIPTALRRELQSKPCAICGLTFGIHCDHIVPVARGGRSVRSNLQPLCRDCNYTKKHLRSNEDVRIVIAGRGLMHFLVAFYRRGTKGTNAYDAPSLMEWGGAHPAEVAEAARLHMEFIAGGSLA
jgi:hypothetical protein